MIQATKGANALKKITIDGPNSEPCMSYMEVEWMRVVQQENV